MLTRHAPGLDASHAWYAPSQSGVVVPDALDLRWSMTGQWVPAKVDERDMGTPDEWVKRHPELVRLTGAPRAAAHGLP